MEHYCRHEWAVRRDDVMLRRAGWHYYHQEADQRAEQVAAEMAKALDWTAATRQAELARYRGVLG